MARIVIGFSRRPADPIASEGTAMLGAMVWAGTFLAARCADADATPDPIMASEIDKLQEKRVTIESFHLRHGLPQTEMQVALHDSISIPWAIERFSI